MSDQLSLANHAVAIHYFRYLPDSEVAGIQEAKTLAMRARPSWIGIARADPLIGLATRRTIAD